MKKSAVILVSNFLSENTRKERRNLLAVSAICIAMTHAKLVPTEITALGIKFAESGQEKLLMVIAGIVIYFLAAFVIYGVADFSIWRLKFSSINVVDINDSKSTLISTRRELEHEEYDYSPDDEEAYISKDEGEKFSGQSEKLSRIDKRWVSLSPFISVTRTVFDFALPVFISWYAIVHSLAFVG